MNNEPVAYLMVDRNDGNSYIQMGVPTRDEKISHQPYPLYTHPVEEQNESFDRTATHMAGEYVSYKPELTDEEILELCPPNHSDMMNEAYTIDFARAILRKAQE